MDDRERWFVHIYQATYEDTYRALTHLVAKHPILRNEFDEILEDTYLEAIRHYEKLKQHSNIAAWIIVTMKNKAKTRCREKRRVLDRLGLRVEVDDDFSMVADNVTPEHRKRDGRGTAARHRPADRGGWLRYPSPLTNPSQRSIFLKNPKRTKRKRHPSRRI